jgi:hypothetical protein
MKKTIFASLFIFAFLNISCSVYQTLVNVSRLKFKLGAVNNLLVDGISVQGKTSVKDFKPLEVIKLTAAIARKSLPVSFTLNVDANNPNDGTGGYPKTNATIKAFPWKLYIENKETISGDLGQPVTVPGTGELTVIPIQINLDLYKFFSDKGFESMINLGFAISGEKGHSSNLALYAKPTVTSPIGDITYPGELKIVSKEFTN